MIIQTNKELPERREHDHYETPLPFARSALKSIPSNFEPKVIIDPGAGSGVWGKAARELWKGDPRIIRSNPHLVGYEVREEAGRPDWYDGWFYKPYQEMSDAAWKDVDLVMGNPPYRYAEEFVRKSMAFLRTGGYLVFLLRLSFLESQKRLKLWKEWPLQKVVVCANRISFTGDGKTNATAYAFYYWYKYDFFESIRPTILEWAYIDHG